MQRTIRLLLALVLLSVGASSALAYSSYVTTFKTTYPSAASSALANCVLCHINPAGGGTRNAYGNAFLSASHNFLTIEPLDSDSDGYTNIAEINALTFPGDASSHPGASADTTPPTVTAFTIPSSSASLTVSISSFTATDNVGVTGYMVNESATAPAATATGWSAAAPASYTASSAGARTLYAWAKDAAGNVSASRTASTTITISGSDSVPPTVSGFGISSVTVSIAGLTATDNVGVAGYIVTESATRPAATAAGWTVTAPASYTFTTGGAKTLYAWAKDAAGNVSAASTLSLTITMPAYDTTAPTITAFAIPATTTSLTVPITSFTATDNVGVTGYIVTESATVPAATAAGWTAAAPGSYTATSAGAKTLYAWAKDAAGNVSASRTASTTITLASSDTTKPTVTAFTVPATVKFAATALSFSVPITLFTATDNVAVTGYMVNESAVAPLATAAGWSAAAPTSYTVASAGVKTLYAWAKDSAGNVSASRTASVTITVLNQSYIGMFRNGIWYLDMNGNGIWDDGTDAIYSFGASGDIPVVGDWNGAGYSSIGVFRGGMWYLKNLVGTANDNNGIADTTISYGMPGDIPVVGDWTNAGRTSIGLFRSGVWYLKNLTGTATDNDGIPSLTYNYGLAGDIPVAGDWTGDGKTKIGLFRPSTSTWYLNLPGTGAWVGCGAPGDITKDACYTGTFGAVGDLPLVGDWNGDGKSGIGYYRPGTNYWYLDAVGDGAWHGCGVDTCYDGSWFGTFGLPADIPVTGAW